MLDRTRPPEDGVLTPKDLRRTYRSPSDREACFVCDRWRSLTHWHHAPSLGLVAKSGVRVSGLKWPVFALCPNHHAAIHAIRDGHESGPKVFYEMTLQDLGRIRAIFRAEAGVWLPLCDQSEGDDPDACCVRGYCEEQLATIRVRDDYCGALERAMRDADLSPADTVERLYAA